MREHIRIGVVAQSRPESGGAFGYENAILEKLGEIEKTSHGTSVEFVDLSASRARRRPHASLTSKVLKIMDVGSGEPRHQLESAVTDSGVDAVYFVSPNWSLESVISVPIISTVWDLGHRDLPEFPEFRGREWLSRERMFRDHLPRCFHIFTDSEFTGERLSRLYGVDLSRWSSIPFSTVLGEADSGTQVSMAQVPDGPYLYYPARFWPHKNHAVLLEAFEMLEDEWPELRLVLTGARGDDYGVDRLIRSSRVYRRVIDFGFVRDEFVEALCRGSLALVMPSLLGPTNLPPVQAVRWSTRAIVSDAHHFDEDLTEFVSTIPGDDAASWATEILSLRTAVATSGSRLNRSDFATLFLPVIDRFESSRSRWLAS